MRGSISVRDVINFVGVRDFGAPALGAVIVNREQNVNIITYTTNITNITTVNNTTINNTTIYNGGPSYATVSAARSSRPIPTLQPGPPDRARRPSRRRTARYWRASRGISSLCSRRRSTAPPAASSPRLPTWPRPLTGREAGPRLGYRKGSGSSGPRCRQRSRPKRPPMLRRDGEARGDQAC